MEKDLFNEPIISKSENHTPPTINTLSSKTKTAVEKIITSKDFAHLFDKISYGLTPIRVFNDFLDMCIYAFSLGKYEDEYLEIVNEYPKEKVHQFAELLSILILSMEGKTNSSIADAQNYRTGTNDILGELFEQRFANNKAGQIFTPQPIADFMAMSICGSPDNFENKSICDPCCGSGRMLFAAKKINPNNHFYGADLDETCCKMTTINLFLNGVKGEIAHMNSLSMEFYKAFKLSGLPKPEITIINDPKDSDFYTKAERMREATPEKFQEQFIKRVGNGVQLELF